MSDALAQVGQFLSSATGKGVLTGATAGGGLIQNFLANRQANQKQKFVQDLITNPAKFNAFVEGFDRPLSKGLTTEVAREADAYGATRGLGSSPAVMQDVYAQALAPSVAAEKNAAVQAALQSLGIYGGTPTMKPIDVSSLLKAIQMGGGSTNPTSGIDLSSVPNPTPQVLLPPPSLATEGTDFAGLTGQ